MTPKIFTSYYQEIPLLLACDILPICIARGARNWQAGYKFYRPLAPSKDLLDGIRDGRYTKKDYIEKYNDQLEKLSAIDVLEQLDKLRQESNKKHIALLCWEKPNQFCHRRIVADWLNFYASTQFVSGQQTPTSFDLSPPNFHVSEFTQNDYDDMNQFARQIRLF